jgi:hypothetical protein
MLRRDFLVFSLGLTVLEPSPVETEQLLVDQLFPDDFDCSVCHRKMPPGTLDLYDDGGWCPSYFDWDGNEVDAVICPECAEKHASHV